MLPRLLFLFAGLLLGAFQTLAQVYEPGLLVRSTGDTLRGEIENSFWEEPPTFIRFRPTPDSPSQLFQPRQLRAVSLTGGRYFRYEALPIDQAAESRTEFVRRNVVPIVRVDSVLAEVLVEGTVTLLRVGRISGPHYLLLGPDQPILDLSARKYLREGLTGNWQLTDGNNYRGQMGFYFRSCPTAFSAVQTAPFTAAGLAAVVQVYNRTCGPEKQAGRSWLSQAGIRQKLPFTGGLIGGARINYIGRSKDDSPCYDCGIRPVLGLYASIPLPSRIYALYGELTFSTFQSYEIEFTPNTTIYRPNGLGWMGTALLGVRYLHKSSREQQWYFGLGYEMNLLWGPSVLGGQPIFAGGIVPVLLPHISVGLLRQRFTWSLDGQMYGSELISEETFGILGGNFALRAGVGYRLGRAPDTAKR